MKCIISNCQLLNSRKFKNCSVLFELRISKYAAKFYCTLNFSERLVYCTSESDSYLFIVRSEMYQLYEVSVNGDHKTCIISTET